MVLCFVAIGHLKQIYDIQILTSFLAFIMTVIIAPYYFSHKLALQLCNAKISVCPFDRTTLYPDWTALQSIITEQQPKMVISIMILTTAKYDENHFKAVSLRHDLCFHTSTPHDIFAQDRLILIHRT